MGIKIEKYIKKPNRIFPRCPTPNPNKLRSNLEKLAIRDGITYDKELYHHVRGLIGEVLSSYEVILREQKRTQKLKECMKIFLNVSNNLERDFIINDVLNRCGINLNEK